MRSECYWYEADKDMGATIPYCKYYDLYGYQAFDRHFGDDEDCRAYITRREVDEIIKHRSVSSTNWIKCEDRVPDHGGIFLVSGRMRYEWEKEYEYFSDVAEYIPYSPCEQHPLGNTGGTDWETWNDWYEGQQEYEILAWSELPDPLEIP